VLLREYSFGPGVANSLAIRLPDGKLLLVSAPSDLSDRELDDLASAGEVSALVANNGAHHLGLPSLHKRFPNAVCYATEDARSRIAKKAGYSLTMLGIDQLQPRLGDKIQVTAAAGCKVGDVIVRVQTDRGPLLYMGDFFANIPKLPWNPLFRLMFKLTNSGPGFKVFGIFFRFFVSDRPALRDFLIREIEAHPPTILVPGHGDVITRNDLGGAMVSMLREAVR
jgi:hypothetical protein